MATRFASGAVLAGIGGLALYFGYPYIHGVVAVAVLLMGWEWLRVCGRSAPWIGGGLLYIGAPALALLWLYDSSVDGPKIVGWIVLVVVATDIGAYVFGKAIGGPKLAPRISPAKTWAGLVGGSACAGLAGGLYGNGLAIVELLPAMLASLLLGVVSQIGDLIESQIKRHFRVKDFGGVIPGHGGVLDRVDGLILAVTTMAVLAAIFGSDFLQWR